MKIDQMNPRAAMLLMEHEPGTRTTKQSGDFAAELVHSQDEISQEYLNELLDKIDEQGAKLSETPTYEELRDYRELVKTFIGEAVSRMYTLQRNSGWDRQGRQKVYTTVKKIDSTLEAMAEEIRLGQASKLSIIARQGAIRGMLVDLYM